MTQGPPSLPGSGYQYGMIAGWYPDPSGDWERRWWDGTCWTADVVTGPVQAQEGFESPEVPAVEQILWDGEGHRLTTHRIWVFEKGSGRPAEELPLWSVAAVEVSTSKVVMTVAYPGYGGRATYTIRSAGAPQLGVLVRKWSNRARRAAMGR